VAKKYRCLGFSGATGLKWPARCSCCNKKPVSSLTAWYSATSNLRWIGSGASWTSTPIRIQYPVCSQHKLIYLIPSFLSGESFLFLFVRVVAVFAFVGGIGGLIGMALDWQRNGHQGLMTSLSLLLPHAAILFSRHQTPIRVDQFSPPVLDMIIRNDEFAEQVAAINHLCESKS
jgi:hypothetical protein